MSDIEPSMVCILLCTFNGATYLSEQLESLKSQSHGRWRLLCRDDGSTDNTVELLHKFQNEMPTGQVVFSNNSNQHLGVFAGFMSLLDRTRPGEIVAFCDQDDIWLPNKLARGVQMLESANFERPTLYCARQALVNKAGQPVGTSPEFGTKTRLFPSALLENIAVGCTYLLNPSAVEALRKAKRPDISVHDWWAYILIQAMGGDVICDDAKTILYRQHGQNTIGAAPSGWKRLWRALTQGPSALGQQLITHLDAVLANQELVEPQTIQIAARLRKAYIAPWPDRLALITIPNLKRHSRTASLINLTWMLFGSHTR